MDDKEDITKQLKPLEFLGVYVSEALSGGWRMWVTRWSWNTHKSRALLIASCLRDFGITDEMLESLPRFKEILERHY